MGRVTQTFGGFIDEQFLKDQEARMKRLLCRPLFSKPVMTEEEFDSRLKEKHIRENKMKRGCLGGSGPMGGSNYAKCAEIVR